jgi:NAD(P)-dependent dehydrogenase (short-subunit alcohol dehydrogenase family)
MKAAQLFDVTGLVTVVTGGGSGIGYAMAEAMADNGARVILVDVDRARIEAAKARLSERGGTVSGEVLDISDVPAVNALFDRIAAEHGRIDVAFANAGVTAGPGYGSPEGVIEKVSMDLWRSSMGVNLDGTFATLQAAARHMKPRRRGSIVVTASIAGLKTSPLPGYAYHAAKAAVAHLVRLAAKEMGAHGVRVNGIAPGPFATNMANGRMLDPVVAAKFAATVPLGRMAEPDEAKGLALLLASPASSYINGAVIPIDGGDSA